LRGARRTATSTTTSVTCVRRRWYRAPPPATAGYRRSPDLLLTTGTPGTARLRLLLQSAAVVADGSECSRPAGNIASTCWPGGRQAATATSRAVIWAHHPRYGVPLTDTAACRPSPGWLLEELRNRRYREVKAVGRQVERRRSA